MEPDYSTARHISKIMAGDPSRGAMSVDTEEEVKVGYWMIVRSIFLSFLPSSPLLFLLQFDRSSTDIGLGLITVPTSTPPVLSLLSIPSSLPSLSLNTHTNLHLHLSLLLQFLSFLTSVRIRTRKSREGDGVGGVFDGV